MDGAQQDDVRSENQPEFVVSQLPEHYSPAPDFGDSRNASEIYTHTAPEATLNTLFSDIQLVSESGYQ
jgi:hypothetical protein